MNETNVYMFMDKLSICPWILQKAWSEVRTVVDFSLWASSRGCLLILRTMPRWTRDRAQSSEIFLSLLGSAEQHEDPRGRLRNRETCQRSQIAIIHQAFFASVYEPRNSLVPHTRVQTHMRTESFTPSKWEGITESKSISFQKGRKL